MWIFLNTPQLIVDLPIGSAVRGPKNVGKWGLFAIELDFEHGGDVDIVVDDQAIAPVAIGVGVRMLFNGLTQAMNDERSEGQSFTRRPLMVPNVCPSVRDIDFDEPVHDVSSPAKITSIEGEATHRWDRLDPVFVFFTHCAFYLRR
jgi:hypothetical protein